MIKGVHNSFSYSEWTRGRPNGWTGQGHSSSSGSLDTGPPVSVITAATDHVFTRSGMLAVKATTALYWHISLILLACNLYYTSIVSYCINMFINKQTNKQINKPIMNKIWHKLTCNSLLVAGSQEGGKKHSLLQLVQQKNFLMSCDLAEQQIKIYNTIQK